MSRLPTFRLKASGNTFPQQTTGSHSNAQTAQAANSLVEVGCGACSCGTAPTRVVRVLSDLAAGRTVADEEIRQHIEDLRFLLETAHDRFLASGLPREESPDYAQANEWRRLRDEALHMLSPEYKRARHIEVLRRADAEPGGTGCYFTDAADRDREAMNEGHR